jgi:hypothetical protein
LRFTLDPDVGTESSLTATAGDGRTDGLDDALAVSLAEPAAAGAQWMSMSA